MELDKEKLFRAAFRTIKGVGSQHLRQLIAYFGSAVQAWEASPSAYSPLTPQGKWINEVLRRKRMIDPDKIGLDLHNQGIKMITPHEANYPALLNELADAPPLLYYRGTLESSFEVLAIVGSRQATSYGKAAARRLGREVVLQGMVVVSGLARGIDTASHQGALDGEGVTWAFLGCGLDQVYPRENGRLAEQIVAKGALISEFPPGTPPLAANFPARNRLISGCARGVVVVEAAERSGAMITVDFALEQGREVFAVPGPIFSPLSRGPHNLLRQGAKIATEIEDICSEISISPKAENRLASSLDNQQLTKSQISENEDHQLVLQQLSDVPLHIDQLAVHSSLSVAALSLALLELQLRGKIKQLPGQHYVLAREC
ncbi:DNA-processing protein DprA [Desulfosporosinus sp. PR]|uniref:DNA-processing protein DprA n=1 Tax=Candidatus Desulfosporosinus nitrosoreducens TaxID=3401928 RepID=UPI0027E8C41C|nr:DNA-processing protein DprA [Desulfosporosinus sp. PR]MDQ7093354.1 DNA-processing protein DprA [Desulfosporosinus sp. PR]